MHWAVSFLLRFLFRWLCPEWFLCIAIVYFEYYALDTLYSTFDSICVQAGEFFTPFFTFFIFNAVPIIPTACYVLVIPFLDKVARDPSAIVYNIAMGLIITTVNADFLSQLTYCGNEAQLTMRKATEYGATAGLLHFVTAGVSFFFMCICTRGEYFIRFIQKEH